MRNNILGGLVISNKNEENFSYKTIELEQKVENPTDLAVLDEEE